MTRNCLYKVVYLDNFFERAEKKTIFQNLILSDSKTYQKYVAEKECVI